jgi:Ca-activated chloride channel homolog
VIDRSSSMSLTDLDYRSRRVARLDAVKDIAKDFLLGNGSDLKGRSGDAIGVVTFAARPQSLSPLVSHREASLVRSIEGIEVARGMEDATAIGDAIALAAARLRVTEEARAISFRSKAIILLTDGQQNWGVKTLTDSAQLAARWNIRIYSVGIRPVSEGAQRDEEVGYGLDVLAAVTNGMSVTATDGSALRRFFSAIDRLEPNTIPASGLRGGWNLTPALALLAFLLVCARIALQQTLMRSAP